MPIAEWRKPHPYLRPQKGKRRKGFVFISTRLGLGGNCVFECSSLLLEFSLCCGGCVCVCVCQGTPPSWQLWLREEWPEPETVSRLVFPRSTPRSWAGAIFEVDRWSECVGLWLTACGLGTRGQMAQECGRARPASGQQHSAPCSRAQRLARTGRTSLRCTRLLPCSRVGFPEVACRLDRR